MPASSRSWAGLDWSVSVAFLAVCFGCGPSTTDNDPGLSGAGIGGTNAGGIPASGGASAVAGAVGIPGSSGAGRATSLSGAAGAAGLSTASGGAWLGGGAGTGAAGGLAARAGALATSGQGSLGGAQGGTEGGQGGTGPSRAGQGQSEAGGGGASAGGAGKNNGGTGGSAPSPTGPVALYLAGDSTVSKYADTASERDQAGWGQMIGALFTSQVSVENRAVGGRTARRFIDESHLAGILEDIRPGDYLLVQFGTNDGNKSATYTLGGQTIPYFLEPATDFKSYLRQYIAGARAAQATPVLVTPPPRNSAYCTGGNGTGAHAAAMRELAQAEGVALVDLNSKAVDHLKAICPAPTPENFFLLRADGTVDGTHFQESGARFLARFVADGLRQATVPVATLLK